MALVSKRLRALQLITALAESTPWGGGDLTGKVFRGRKYLPNDTGSTMVSILESPKPDFAPTTAGSNNLKQDTLWTLLVQGFLPDTPEHPTDPAYEFMAAVEQRLSRMVACDKHDRPLYPDDYMLGKLVAGINLGPGVVRPPDKEISDTAFFYTPLVLKFISDPSNPYVEVG